MSLNIVNRMPPVVAAQSPVYFNLQTLRHVHSPGSRHQGVVRFRALPPPLAAVEWAGLRWEFRSLATGLDAFNPAQVSLEGSPSLAQLAQRLADAVSSHVQAQGVFSPNGVLDLGTEAELYLLSDAETDLGPLQVLDPSGLPYTAPADPLEAQTVQAGLAPVLRPNYALLLEVNIENAYRQDPSYRSLPRLRLPAAPNALPQEFKFRIDGLLRLPLGFDLPPVPNPAQPDARLQAAHGAFRQFFVRFAEQYDAGAAGGGKWFRDEEAGQPVNVLVLNARLDDYAHQPQPILSPEGCPTGGTVQPYGLQAWFVPDADGLLRWLTPFSTHGLLPGQPFWLAFYALPAADAFADPANLQLRLEVQRNGQQETLISSLDLSQLRSCAAGPTGFAGQIWMLPLHSLWDELDLHRATRFALRLWDARPASQRPLLHPQHFQVLPGCPDGAPAEVLLYQNPLGLPEALHALPRPELDWDVDDLQAQTQPLAALQQPWQTQSVRRRARLVGRCSLPLGHAGALKQAQALLSANRVFRLDAPPDAPPRWQPVVLEARTWRLQRSTGSTQPLRLQWTESRVNEDVRR